MSRIDPRPLTPSERAVVELILSADFAGVETLRLQASSAAVVGRCDCGCPSIDLQVAADAPAVEDLLGPLLPVEGRVRPVDGEPVGEIIVFVEEGTLRGLEYVHYTDSPPAFWPELERIDLL